MGAKYSSQSTSGYNSSPPADDGSTVAANKITWAGIKSKLTDVLKTFGEAINSALVTALDTSMSTTSVNYTTLAGDHLKPIEASGTITISLGDATTMAAGYQTAVYNKGTGTVTVSVVTATDKLNGQTNGTVTLPPGAAMKFGVNQAANGYDILSRTGFSPVLLSSVAGTNTVTAAAPANVIALYSGLTVYLIPANTNTGATTLNITPSGGSALTAKNVFANGAACVGGELVSGVPVTAVYDGTQFNILGGSFPRYKIGSLTRDVSAVNGAVSTTGIGFRPRAVLFLANVGGGSRMSIGFSNASVSGVIYDQNTTSAGTYNNNGADAVVMWTDGSNFSEGALTSLDADGFTITWTKTGAPTGVAAIYYLALW